MGTFDPQKECLPTKKTGDVVSAEDYNRLVCRVNDLWRIVTSDEHEGEAIKVEVGICGKVKRDEIGNIINLELDGVDLIGWKGEW